MKTIPTQSFPPVVKSLMTLRGANSFRNRLPVCIKRYSILTGSRKFSWARLRNWSASEDRVTESCVSMDPIKVLVLSSVVPNAVGSGGELMLHRHLKLNCGIQFEVVRWQRFPFRLKLIGKLRQLGFQSLSRSWECLFPVFPPKKMIRKFIERYQPDVLITVAHGAWHMQARRIAQQCELALVALFQDWWPDFS